MPLDSCDPVSSSVMSRTGVSMGSSPFKWWNGAVVVLKPPSCLTSFCGSDKLPVAAKLLCLPQGLHCFLATGVLMFCGSVELLVVAKSLSLPHNLHCCPATGLSSFCGSVELPVVAKLLSLPQDLPALVSIAANVSFVCGSVELPVIC